MEAVFDANPGHRTEAEWRRLLGELVQSLAAYTAIEFTPTSWFIDDQPGHAHAGACVDVRGVVSSALRLNVCGVVGVSVNHAEAAWVIACLLLFSDGQRVIGPDGFQFVSMTYRVEGWSTFGWVADEFGEWESHDTDARWSSDPDRVK